MELARIFAIGALVYNLTGIIVGLLWDIDVELVELDQSSVPPIPIPNN